MKTHWVVIRFGALVHACDSRIAQGPGTAVAPDYVDCIRCLRTAAYRAERPW